MTWQAGRLLVPAPWQNQDAECRVHLLALEMPGQIGPFPGPGWQASLQGATALSCSATDLNAHGFQLQVDHVGTVTGWMAAAGVLVLDVPLGLTFELTCNEATVTRSGSVQEVETNEGVACIAHHAEGRASRTIVLAYRMSDPLLVRSLAERDWPNATLSWKASQQPLEPFWSGQSPLRPAHNLALACAVDDLTAALRGASGVLPFIWSFGPSDGGPGQPTDDLYGLVRAWSCLQPAIATDLVKSALSAQSDDGAIPRVVRPDGFHDERWAPLPLLTRCAWLAWQALPDKSFHDYVMPRLQRYLHWAISYFDPEWRGLPIWRDAREAWTPETYNPLVASADLPSMLASELDAFRDLARAVPYGPPPDEDLLRYRGSLGRTLGGFFWNPETTMFQDRFPAGHHVLRFTLSATLPMLDTTLGRDALLPVAERLAWGGSLRDPRGVREWSPWPEDAELPPVRESHQLLVLDALEGAGAREVAAGLRQDMAMRHAAEAPRRLELSEAALRVITLGKPVLSGQPFAMTSPLLTWLDRHRMAVMSWTVSLVAGVLVLIIISFMFKRTVTTQTAGTALGLARRLYQEQHYDQAYQLLNEVLASGRTFPGLQLNRGNAAFRLGRWEEAEAAYRSELKANPNAVMAQLNLALTLLNQQRKQEASEQYQSVTNRYAEADPLMAQRAATALRLLADHPFYRVDPDPAALEKK